MVGSILYNSAEVEFNQTECVVCLEEFQNDEKIISLSCYHIFHRACLNEAVIHCPVCRIPQRSIKLILQIPETKQSNPHYLINLLSLRILFEGEFDIRDITLNIPVEERKKRAKEFIINSFQEAVTKDSIRKMRLCQINTHLEFLSFIRTHSLYRGINPEKKRVQILQNFIIDIFNNPVIEECNNTCLRKFYELHADRLISRNFLFKFFYLHNLSEETRVKLLNCSHGTELEKELVRYRSISTCIPLILIISCLGICILGITQLPGRYRDCLC